MRRLPKPKFFLPDPVVRRRQQATVDEAVEKTHDCLVVSHRGCPDGVGSYLVHALVMEHPPPVVWGQPGEMQDIVADVARHAGEGRTLSINDLSLDREKADQLQNALADAKNRGWRVVWRDHHHKQWEGVDVAGLEAHMDSFVLDREGKECGASLAQKDLAPEDPLARELAAIVRDRDLWINEDPRSEMYEMAVRALGPDTFVERFLATRDVDAAWIRKAADGALREREQETEQGVLSASLHGEKGEVGLVYGDVPTNAVLHTLRERRGTRVEINMKPEGRFSVRTAPDTKIAHLLGQAYHGGGHPNAAGGLVPVKPWEWPAYWLRGGDSPAGRSVVKTALRLLREYDETGEGQKESGSPSKKRQREKQASVQGSGSATNGKDVRADVAPVVKGNGARSTRRPVVD